MDLNPNIESRYGYQQKILRLEDKISIENEKLKGDTATKKIERILSKVPWSRISTLTRKLEKHKFSLENNFKDLDENLKKNEFYNQNSYLTYIKDLKNLIIKKEGEIKQSHGKQKSKLMTELYGLRLALRANVKHNLIEKIEGIDNEIEEINNILKKCTFGYKRKK